MKLTKSKLKQLIKEEMFNRGAESGRFRACFDNDVDLTEAADFIQDVTTALHQDGPNAKPMLTQVINKYFVEKGEDEGDGWQAVYCIMHRSGVRNPSEYLNPPKKLRDLPEEPMFERKLTKSKLKQLIKEELKTILNERVTSCELEAMKKAANAAYGAGDKYLNAKWDLFRDKLGNTPPNKAMPIRKALLKLWKEGWYKIIKDIYDASGCVNYADRALEEENNSLVKWLLNPNSPTSPQEIDGALNNALRNSVR